MRHGYPVVLDLETRRCLVVGGGRAAELRVEELLAAGAEVTVEAAALTPRLAELAAGGALRWVARDYQSGDAEGFLLIVAAREGRELNHEIFAEAERRGALVNCYDDPEHCRFAFPSVHRQGDLVIAISTNGKCPAMAVRLRERFQDEFGPAYAAFLRRAGKLRTRLADRVPEFDRRRQLWFRRVDSFLRSAKPKEHLCQIS